MSHERSFGLQWRLAVIFLAVGVGSTLAALTAYLAGLYFDLSGYSALSLGLGAGLLIGLIGAVVGSMIARSFKLRLWEAGRMAGRIARGDYLARLEPGPDDEVGWLEEQFNQMAVQLETAVGSLRELAEKNRLLGEEAGRGAALEERMRFARDLHDTVNQQLFVLAMRTAAVKRRLEQAGGEAALLQPEVSALEELAGQAHKQIRELILEIRPITLEQEGLGAALKEYVSNVAERENLVLTDRIDISVRPAAMVGESLFRIAQESLNNISKHASAEHIEVLLILEKSQVRLKIVDDGIGFDPRGKTRPTAVGLSGIRERAEGLGGSLSIESSPGRGTAITVLIPLKCEGGERR